MEEWKEHAKSIVWNKLKKTKITRKNPVLFRNSASIYNFALKHDMKQSDIMDILEEMIKEGTVRVDNFKKYQLTKKGLEEYLQPN